MGVTVGGLVGLFALDDMLEGLGEEQQLIARVVRTTRADSPLGQTVFLLNSSR